MKWGAANMARCEDFPCCGHEPGACPDENGAFPCASCGATLPKGNRSAVCDGCHERHAQADDDHERGVPGSGDGSDDLADHNANEADDYANEGREDFGWGGDEALCGE